MVLFFFVVADCCGVQTRSGRRTSMEATTRGPRGKTRKKKNRGDRDRRRTNRRRGKKGNLGGE